MVFELFTAGRRRGRLVGAGCLVLGCYGLAVLPTNRSASACSSFAMFGFAIDVQTGVPGSGAAIAHRARSSSARSLLYDGLSLSWITLARGASSAWRWR